MSRKEYYHIALRDAEDRIEYLIDNSRLPGKRGNLELLEAFTEFAGEELFNRCLSFKEAAYPTNTPGEFVATCGAAGLGKLIWEGKHQYRDTLRKSASDSRWRVREGVAFALQFIGLHDFDFLIGIANEWKAGNLYERRAVVAGLCEPALLKQEDNAGYTLGVINEIAGSIIRIEDRRTDAFRVLKQALGYGLSVAVASFPEKGKELFENLLYSTDKDLRWILKENLKKKRLERMDPDWTRHMQKVLQ